MENSIIQKMYCADGEKMKPSELIKVLQQAIDAGVDDTTQIFFDTEARKFNYHMAEIDHANFEPDVLDKPFISLHEKH